MNIRSSPLCPLQTVADSCIQHIRNSLPSAQNRTVLKCCDVYEETECFLIFKKVSVVSGCGLEVRGFDPRQTEGFSSNLCVQTGSGAHPASCTVGTGGSFPGGKARPGRDADRSLPSSAEVKKE
jgi:hypothetical protein